ncbi:conserved hypothetical protein [Verticillium alfalfae VaMs.102]|uniref:Type 1 phosphatases regulator n=1 Tax=Verticillium alfalfae (strain VaMs.102 / ATCC MYA-4576 / FGSC 10136) TaxID=526221 RepID=C9SAS2_VERA1|nr:conserved hypothetical protein [Verticillium alfalfae VaMs.102]EEY15496.1 conserved hypothetical protein [Verticillium alfalfae VaMs.102]
MDDGSCWVGEVWVWVWVRVRVRRVRMRRVRFKVVGGFLVLGACCVGEMGCVREGGQEEEGGLGGLGLLGECRLACPGSSLTIDCLYGTASSFASGLTASLTAAPRTYSQESIGHLSPPPRITPHHKAMASAAQRPPQRGSPAPSQTQTVTTAPVRPNTHQTTLRLRGAHAPARPSVQWADDVVDNEGLGRKKSKDAVADKGKEKRLPSPNAYERIPKPPKAKNDQGEDTKK